MIGFREATPEDAGAILALRRRCFPEDDLEKPRPTRMFIAEAEGRPVAHLGLIPQTYVIDGQDHAGALAVDAMTDPAYRKQGLFRRVAAFARDTIRGQYALSTAWQIRPAVLGAMVATGWAPILRATVFVKPLLWGLRRHGRCHPERESRDLGGRGSEERSSRSAHPGPSTHARDDSGHAPMLANYAHVRHDPTRFDAPYYIHTETCVTRATVLRGHRTLAVVDFTGKPILPKTDARLAAALITWRHPLLPQLLRSGFLPSPHQFRFLVNVFDARIDAKRLRWALTWADTDHL